MNNAQTLRCWLALYLIPGIGPRFFHDCLARGDSPEQLFTRSSTELQAAGYALPLINALQQPDWPAVDRLLQWQQQAALRHIITLQAADYPALLRSLPDAPPVLFAQGNRSLLQQPQIALVGSRKPTPLGLENAAYFAKELVTRGITVTSGLALGIDTASHQGALQAGGDTIAVLGSGLACIYPKQNLKLADMLAEHGLLLSEFPPLTSPKAHYFPRRNRIISGLSLGVLVIEATLRSGSLITARLAAEQGREVFAIPGSIHNPQSKGCHALIHQGAKLVETVEDILQEISSLLAVPQPNSLPSQSVSHPLCTTDQALLACIDDTTTTMDTVIQRSGMHIADITTALLRLELQGYVVAALTGYYRVRAGF